MATYSSGKKTMGNNGVLYTGTWTRSGTQLTIDLKISTKWLVDSMASGWTFGIYKSDGTALKSQNFTNWTCGSYSTEYSETKTLFASATYNLGTTAATTVTVGCKSMSYNGTTYNMTYGISMAASLTAPGNVTGVKLSGRFENGHTSTCTWTATPNATSYVVERRFWKKPGGVYSAWSSVGTYTTNTCSVTHSNVTDHSQQFRVYAKNAAGSSPAWTESNWNYHDGIMFQPSTSAKMLQGYIKVWNGTSWVQGYVSVWDGSKWVVSKSQKL